MRLGYRMVVIVLSATIILGWSDHIQAKERRILLTRMVTQAVVYIRHLDSAGKELAQATGFFIDNKGMLVTNYHVIRQASELRGAAGMEVITFQGKKYPVKKIIDEDKSSDVAIAQANLPGDEEVSFLKMQEQLPSPGQSILVVGNPRGLRWTVSEGIVSAIRKVGPENGYQIMERTEIQFTAPVTKGSSGSPIVDNWGRVLGVVKHGLDDSVDTATGQLVFGASAQSVMRLVMGNGQTVREYLSEFYLAESIKLFKERIKKAQTKYEASRAHQLLGLSLIGRHRLQEGAAAFEEAIRFDPTSADAHYQLGLIYLEMGDERAYKRQCDILEGLDETLAAKLKFKAVELSRP